MLYNDAVKNVFLILVSLAFVSFAQAGPFGLKNGMTVDEIIEAGFEINIKKCESISGSKYLGGRNPNQGLKELESKYYNFDSTNDFSYTASEVTNAKHPNIVFQITMSKFTGLIRAYCKIHNKKDEAITDEAFKRLYQVYSEKLAKKYKTKYGPIKSNPDWVIKYRQCNVDPPVNGVTRINLTANVYPIHETNRMDERTFEKFIGIGYYFSANELHVQKTKAALEKKQQEQLKNLIPKEEDL